MSQIQGQTLEELVQSSGPLPEAQALDYIRQIGSALSSLHQQGKLHRGVSPKTILKQESGVTLQPSQAVEQGSQLALDSPVARYLPIEQTVEGLTQTPATDIYSLAATLYYLLTGHPPIAASLRQRVPLSELRQLQPNLSLHVEQAIAQGMQVESTWRPQTIESWLSLLPTSNANASEPRKPTGNYKMLSLGTPQRSIPSVNPGTPQRSIPPVNPEPATTRATAAVNPPPVVSPSGGLPLANAAPPPPPTKLVTRPTHSSLKPSLLKTAVIALLVGAGFGLALRFGLKYLAGSTLLHRDQSFPARENWPDAGGAAGKF